MAVRGGGEYLSINSAQSICSPEETDKSTWKLITPYYSS